MNTSVESERVKKGPEGDAAVECESPALVARHMTLEIRTALTAMEHDCNLQEICKMPFAATQDRTGWVDSDRERKKRWNLQGVSEPSLFLPPTSAGQSDHCGPPCCHSLLHEALGE